MQFLHDKARTGLFIDGNNLYAANRALGFDIDYKAMLAWFWSKSSVYKATYYAALLGSEEHNPLKPLTDWLAYNGYTFCTKEAREFTDHTGARKVKGNMDIEIAIDVVVSAPTLDHIILFSGDSDFVRPVQEAQRAGAFVTVISTTKSTPPICSDDLRRAANQFVELNDLRDHFTRARKDDAPVRALEAVA